MLKSRNDVPYSCHDVGGKGRIALDKHTANIFKVIFTVFNCVRLSTVVSLYGLHLIAAPSTIK